MKCNSSVNVTSIRILRLQKDRITDHSVSEGATYHTVLPLLRKRTTGQRMTVHTGYSAVYFSVTRVF
jgi:hypothetical protein